MKRCIHINGRRIANDRPPYVVAEMSANHNGSLDAALRIIDAARAAGAEAVKLQTYTADTMTFDSDAEDFTINDGIWGERRLHDLYAEAYTPWEWHAPLFEHAREVGITLFSSPFDRTAVDLLEDLGAPAYKIASFEAVDLPLIEYVAGTGKPMIISTGMADANEIGEAVAAARAGGCQQLAVLRCVSSYPAPAADYNLRTLADMQDRFGVVVGLSDHTLDHTTAIASVALGASLVEKHLTLDRSGGGPDDSFSLEPPELAALCQHLRTAWSAIGRVDYERKASEREAARFRRSLYFVADMAAGEIIGPECVRSVRPGQGLAPKHLNRVVGRRLARAVKARSPVRWGDIV